MIPALRSMLKVAVIVIATRQINASHGQTTISDKEPGSLHREILEAAKAGRSTVKVPPGMYRIAAGADRSPLEFSHLADLDIDASDATFLWQDPTKGGSSSADAGT